jgi:ribosomal protein L40E
MTEPEQTETPEQPVEPVEQPEQPEDAEQPAGITPEEQEQALADERETELAACREGNHSIPDGADACRVCGVNQSDLMPLDDANVGG